ncbi:response regulator [Aestuariivirga litoralis]|uniref:response regulator n=1 Tax=Aestuariivirga litoralis TaxID=2650924 RepID=UPI0018C45836|nr:response regulator [Aestuariivirga litoralis]MBG1232785.1 response regulator [Aestuariivirga litoralis]
MTASSAARTVIFPRPDGKPRRVLYAEDQETSRVVTKAMLERMGFLVDAVEDGELALHAARNDNYDVILLDIEMPVMDGVTAARMIRAELEHVASTPILALSAFLADSTEHSIWRDAFDSALPKPTTTRELFKVMHAAVTSRDTRAKAAKPKQAAPSMTDYLNALKTSLPSGLWRRLSATAAQDMHHLVNVLGAAQQTNDKDLCAEAARKLIQMATTFGAAKVAELARNAEVAVLRREVTNWAMG